MAKSITLFAISSIGTNSWPALQWQQRLAAITPRVLLLDSPLTRNQFAWVAGQGKSTGETIKEYCLKKKIAHTAKILDQSSVAHEGLGDRRIPPPGLHFVTPPSATSATGPTTTLLYFHGGGYAHYLPSSYIPLHILCAAACKARQLVFLESSLTPEHPYPAQLVQAIAALRHLLDVEGIRPSEIVLGGDSAGGGLVASLLAHLAKPCPYADPIDLKGEQLRGVYFTSPWVFLSTDQPSYDTNAKTDFLTREAILEFGRIWQPKMDEVWAAPCETRDSAEVWDEVYPSNQADGIVAKTLILNGTAEVLHDGILRFGREFTKAKIVTAAGGSGDKAIVAALENEARVLVECLDEVHVHIGLDVAVGYHKGAGVQFLMSWLRRL